MTCIRADGILANIVCWAVFSLSVDRFQGSGVSPPSPNTKFSLERCNFPADPLNLTKKGLRFSFESPCARPDFFLPFGTLLNGLNAHIPTRPGCPRVNIQGSRPDQLQLRCFINVGAPRSSCLFLYLYYSLDPAYLPRTPTTGPSNSERGRPCWAERSSGVQMIIP